MSHDPSQPIASGADIAALRSDFYVRLDESDDQLLRVLAGQDDLVHLARRWGWHDTEVRDTAALIFEVAFGRELP